MLYLSSTYPTCPVPESFDAKQAGLLAQREIDALYFKYDYTSLQVFVPLKAYLEQNRRWVYDGNGRWSTSDRLVRLRSDGETFHLEVWVISGHVQRTHKLAVGETSVLLRQLRSVGV